MSRISSLGLLVVALTAVGCPGDQAGRHCSAVISPAPRPTGEALFLTHCARCHGESGDGHGPAAASLKTQPRPFSSGIFKFTSTAGMPSDPDLFQTLTMGIAGTQMTSFSKLDTASRWALVRQVKRLTVNLRPVADEHEARRRFGNSLQDVIRREGKLFARVNLFAQRGTGTRVVVPQPPPLSEALLAIGEEAYMGEGGCFNCHGYEGNGEGPRALGLKDDITNQAILPTDFTRGVFKRGSSLRELYLRVTTGIPGTPMPSTELTPRQRWGLAYYLRTFSAERK